MAQSTPNTQPVPGDSLQLPQLREPGAAGAVALPPFANAGPGAPGAPTPELGHSRTKSIPKPVPSVVIRPEDIISAQITPPLLQIDSSLVSEALAAAPAPQCVGQFLYHPKVPPVKVLPVSVLSANNVGHTVDVYIPTAILNVKFSVGDPAAFVPSAEEIPEVTARLYGAVACLNNRPLWGTDIYTDDSDLLAVALHSGWLRVFGAPDHKGKKRSSEHIRLTLQIAPPLLRYQSCVRQGLKSRSWGNSHDGFSLLVLNAELTTDIPALPAHPEPQIDPRLILGKRPYTVTRAFEVDPVPTVDSKPTKLTSRHKVKLGAAQFSQMLCKVRAES